MKLLAVMGTSMMIAIIMQVCTIATIFMIYVPITTFAYYRPAIVVYRQTVPTSDILYSHVVSASNRSEEQSIPQQQQSKVIEASGHFANNQIQNGSVTWIQGGLWDLVVRNNTNMNNKISNNTSAAPIPSPKAAFSANFTMVKPDGSESHTHSINNFVSNNVIIGGGDMVITGIGNIYSDGTLKFKQVPITVHLMGRQHVLGLIIETDKTENHYASTHEMFGTLINGTGLDIIEKTLQPSLPPQQHQNNNKGMNMNGMSM